MGSVHTYVSGERTCALKTDLLKRICDFTSPMALEVVTVATHTQGKAFRVAVKCHGLYRLSADPLTGLRQLS